MTRAQIRRNYETGTIMLGPGRIGLGALGADPYASSTAQYVRELTSINQRLADIEQQIPLRDGDILAELQAEKIRLMARKSAIQWWLNLSTAQKNTHNGLTAVTNKTNSFLSALNKLKDEYDTSGDDIFSTLTDFNIAGFPGWAILLLVPVGIYLFTQYKKKR